MPTLTDTPPNPSGLCMCGCGETTPIATYTARRQHSIKGEHLRYVNSAHGGRRSIDHRLWNNAVTDPETGCWEWQRATHHFGYGLTFHEGRQQVAHRVAWQVVNGPIPEGMLVCHSCDNPPCINPEHLFLGTQADNIADMLSKQRGRLAETHPKAKFGVDAVRRIRALAASGVYQRVIASEFGVSQSVISNIVTGKRWGNVR